MKKHAEKLRLQIKNIRTKRFKLLKINLSNNIDRIPI